MYLQPTRDYRRNKALVSFFTSTKMLTLANGTSFFRCAICKKYYLSNSPQESGGKAPNEKDSRQHGYRATGANLPLSKLIPVRKNIPVQLDSLRIQKHKSLNKIGFFQALGS